jgi:putative Mg2+ transporter-C (MgtC) family protein
MEFDFFLSVGLSLLFGSLVGIERQWHRRLVDLKTNALVSLGACLFMIVTKSTEGFTDPVRMAAQIVVGVGFIGGGLLFRDGAQTKGINTAATLWCCAAVGTLCGLERWLEAASASLVIVVANTVLRKVAQYLNLKMGINDSLTEQVKFELTCSVAEAPGIRQAVEALFLEHKLDVRSVQQQTQSLQTSISVCVLLEHEDVSSQIRYFTEKINALKVSDCSWSHI